MFLELWILNLILLLKMARAYFKRIEDLYLKEGYDFVLGVDEVGRGPLAGPMVLGLVVYSPILLKLKGLNDSKKLSQLKRDALSIWIEENLDFALGVVSAKEIDEIGLTLATELAIDRGLKVLATKFDLTRALILMDGNYAYKSAFGEVKTVVKGDSKVRVIAAASNVAKVFRDNLMIEYAKIYPGYNFKKNVGYGTKEHRLAIQKQGSCKIHRKSFLSKINAS